MVSQHDLTLCSQKELLSIIAQLQHDQEHCRQENVRLRLLLATAHEHTQDVEQALQQQQQATEIALTQLRTLQQQFIEAEKMASLGNLVAGIAHEINTPLGISLTAVSQLEELARMLQHDYQSGPMKRAQLEKYLRLVQQGHYLANKNLSRAVELMHSFKQVAVDQSSDQRRTFKLNHYLTEIITSLQPQLKSTGYQIIIDCDDSIILSSYPGIFSQIITNLIMNSMTHGFKGQATGTIKISAILAAEKSLLLQYSDDGEGIAQDVIDHIFEPYFTTNGQGGSSG